MRALRALSVCVMLGIVCGGVLAQATGGAVEVSSTDPGAYYSTGALVDGQSGLTAKCWRSAANGTLPQWIVFTPAGAPATINSVTIDPYTGYPDLAGPFWPKDVVIQVISTPGAEPVEVARQTLDPGREAKTIEFAPTAAAQVRIEILSVQGGGNVVEISEVSAGTAAAAPTEDPAVPVEEPPVEEDPVTPPPAEEGPVTVPPGEEGPVTVPPVEEVPPPPVEEVPPPPVEEVPPPPVEEVPPPPVEEVPPPPVEEVPPPPVEEVPPPPVEEVPPPPVEEVPPPPAEDATTPAAGSVNLAAAAAGGVITVPNSLESKFGPEHLNDGVYDGSSGDCWVSGNGLTFPYDIVVSFANSAVHEVTGVSVTSNTGQEYIFGARWPQDVQILVSSTGTQPGDFQAVQTATLAKSAETQNIPLTPVEARYVMIRVLSNHGHKTMEMSEIEVWGSPQPAGGAAVAPTAPVGEAPVPGADGGLPRNPDGTVDEAALGQLLAALRAQITNQQAVIDQLLAELGQ
ncbi:MAG: discoidin domain-containing protein [candidate division WS1 bacterium]|nr:discoidin domain-containing protein [candidate division WS1 bacterium]